MDVGTPELLLLGALVVLLFGGSKLPQMARKAGSAIKEAKDEVNGAKAVGSEFKSQLQQTKAELDTNPQKPDTGAD